MVQLKTSHLSITSSWTMKFQVGWLANCDWKNISLWERMTHGSWNRNFLRQTARKTIQSLIKHSKCPFDQKNLWRFTCGYELPYWNLWCWQVQHLRWNWKTLLPQILYFHFSENYKIFKCTIPVVLLGTLCNVMPWNGQCTESY